MPRSNNVMEGFHCSIQIMEAAGVKDAIIRNDVPGLTRKILEGVVNNKDNALINVTVNL